MTFKRIIRAILTSIPYVGSPIEQLLFGTKDDKEIRKIKDKIEKSDIALGIKRDKEGNVINNPYNFGKI